MSHSIYERMRADSHTCPCDSVYISVYASYMINHLRFQHICLLCVNMNNTIIANRYKGLHNWWFIKQSNIRLLYMYISLFEKQVLCCKFIMYTNFNKMAFTQSTDKCYLARIFYKRKNSCVLFCNNDNTQMNDKKEEGIRKRHAYWVIDVIYSH